MPKKNWVVDCIERRSLALRTPDGTRVVNCDPANLVAIRGVADTVRDARAAPTKPRRITLPLPSPSAPTPLLAGLAGAYQLLDGKRPGVVVLVTQDERLADLARDLVVRTQMQESRIEEIFAVGHIYNNSLSRQAFVREGVRLDRFRLVIAERFDTEDMKVLDENGVPVALVLFDGRTRKPDRTFTATMEVDATPPGVYVLLTPSTKLVVPGWPALDSMPDDRQPIHNPAGCVPLLVTPAKPNMKLRAHRVELDTRALLADIFALRVHDDPMMKRFFDEALSTYNALLAAPVHPTELDPVYRGQGRERVPLSTTASRSLPTTSGSRTPSVSPVPPSCRTLRRGSRTWRRRSTSGRPSATCCSGPSARRGPRAWSSRTAHQHARCATCSPKRA